jgi:hypothetical protein
VASAQYIPRIQIEYNKRLKETKNLPDKVVELNEFIDVKGLKAQGNQLTKLKVKEITLLPTGEGEDWPEVVQKETKEQDEENDLDIVENETDANQEDSTEEDSSLEMEGNREDTDDLDDSEDDKDDNDDNDDDSGNDDTPPSPKPIAPVPDEKPIEVEWEITPIKPEVKKEVEEDKVDPNAKKKKSNPIKDSDKGEDQMSLF